MAVETFPATPAEGPALTKVLLNALSDGFHRTLFPDTDDVHAWWEARITKGIGSPETHEVYFKAVETQPGEEPTIIARAKWVLPLQPTTVPGREGGLETVVAATKNKETSNAEAASWPPSSDTELCDALFSAAALHRAKLMGERPHCHLSILVVDPAHQRRGIGAKLLQWGLSYADEREIDVFLAATPDGRPLYAKNGFGVVGSESFRGGYTSTYMVRPARGGNS